MPDVAEAGAHAAHKAGAGLSKQVGPLPMGAWIVVVGGSLGIAYFFNRTRPGGSSGDGAATSGDQVGTGAVSTWAATSPPATPAAGDTKPTTNDEWAQQAASYLLAQNDDPALVDAAIRDYLFGNPLTSNEQAVISAAIKHLGIPPEPLPPISPPTTVRPIGPIPVKPPIVVKPPAPKPKPKPPPPAPPKRGVRYYTVQRGDSLWKIAQHFYHNGALWPRIYNANRGLIRNPNRIYPGWRLVIP